jgi:hypothetical protein
MRADPAGDVSRTCARWAAVALAAALAAGVGTPRAARAQDLSGFAQGQYQTFEQLVRRADGTYERNRIERWVNSFELQHMAMPTSELRIASSFRVSDLRYRGLPDQSRTPQGTFQISHPWANLFAAYRPTTVTGGFGRGGSSAPGDTNRLETFTARSQEAVLTGQIAPPAWPRLDLAWTRRHRNADALSEEEAGVNRLARLSWNRALGSVYGSLGDQVAERSGLRQPGSQRTASAGGTLHLMPRPDANLDLGYDLSDARVGDPAQNAGSARGHTASMNANWRQDPLTHWSANWYFRRNESRGPQRLTTNDHEGTLQWAFDPNGPLRFLAAGGARTVRHDGHEVMAKSMSGVASAEGRVRTGWTGIATLTHVTNWEPGLGHWSVEAARLSSQLRVTRGFDCFADGQLSTSDDTTARAVRAATEANLRARLTPWPALTVGLASRFARSGVSLGTASAGVARTVSWDARWRPIRTFEVSGTTTRSHSQQGVIQRTRTFASRWSVHRNLQLSADWSRSSDERATASAQYLSGREIASVHALALLTPKLQLDASAGAADRGTARETRQASVTLTWAFRR